MVDSRVRGNDTYDLWKNWFYTLNSYDELVIDKIKRYIDLFRQANVAYSSIYLFGSYATNSSTELSDIDVAVVMKKVNNLFFDNIELTKISSKTDSRIEPHIILESDFHEMYPIAREVLREGIQIV